MNSRQWILFAAVVFGGAFPSPGWAEKEIIVGRDSLGQLKVRIEFTIPSILPVSIFPGIQGFATGEIGVHSAVSDEPGNDFYVVSPTADFRLILVAKEPGMEVWNDSGSGFMQVGDTFYVGPAPFDTHPLWNLLVDSPGVARSLTVKFRDLNGIYPESDPFVISFAAPPRVSVAWAAGSLVLAWPVWADGLVLEQNTTLGPGGIWMPIQPPYPVEGNAFSLTLSMTTVSGFFRLRGP